ncbi:MAG: GxxExxY protein [Flavobacteriales bacterium]
MEIKTHKVTKERIDKISYEIVGAAIEVHKLIGPGLLESVYQKCLKKEFAIRNLQFSSETIVNTEYKGMELDVDLRADFFVEGLVVVELKCVEVIIPVHEAQVLTYMRLFNAPKAILLNFYCTNLFHQGQRTFVSEEYRALPDK